MTMICHIPSHFPTDRTNTFYKKSDKHKQVGFAEHTPTLLRQHQTHGVAVQSPSNVVDRDPSGLQPEDKDINIAQIVLQYSLLGV